MTENDKNTILGQVLLSKNLITNKQLNNAYQIQSDTQERLSVILIRNKMVTAIEVYKVLADLSNNEINNNLPEKIKRIREEIDFNLCSNFKPSFLNKKLFVPIDFYDNIIKIAVYDFKDKSIDSCLKKMYGDILIEKIEMSKTKIMYLIEYSFKARLLEDGKSILKSNKRETALNVFTRGQLLTIGIISILIITGLYFNYNNTLEILHLVLNVVFVVLIGFRFFSYLKKNIGVKDYDLADKSNLLSEEKLPHYSILIPVDEKTGSLKNLFLSLEKMDYPKEKMEVIILIKESARDKINELPQLKKDWQLYIVPQKEKQSQVQIYNYGLKLAKGKYITIYKANHIPELDQLKEAASKFELSNFNYFCLQSSLESAEADKGLFSNYLSIENSLKYNFFSYLDKGTYHYRVKALRNYGGWDLYNSAENLDIIRKAEVKGYKIGLINAKTYQNSSDHFDNWFTLFVSSLKGYMQTLLVYNRNPISKIKEDGIKDLFYNNITIGGELFVPLLYTVLLLSLVANIITVGNLDNLFKIPIQTFTLINIILFLLFNCYYILNTKLELKLIKKLAILPLMPIHWTTKAYAFLKAVFQLVLNPHYRTELKSQKESEDMVFMQISFLKKINEVN